METYSKKTGSAVYYGLVLFLFALMVYPVNSLRAQWNTNTSVNLLISSLPTADIQSVPTTDGKTWIAFYHETGGNYNMRAQLIDADGYKLLGNDGMLVNNHPSGSATFVFNVCTDLSNNLIIAMQDERSGPLQAVVYKISQSGTFLWGADGIVLAAGLAPYPATLTTGETVVAWIDDASSTLNMQKIDENGNLVWGAPVTIMVGSSRTTRGQIIANTSGKFTVVYQKLGTGIYTTLYAQMFFNSGSYVFPPLQICNETTMASTYYSIDAQSDTTYFGFYSSAGMRFNSHLQRINPNGTIPWGMNGSNFNTMTGSGNPYQMETSIKLDPSSPYVWAVCTFSNTTQSNYGVYVQKFRKTSGSRMFGDLAKVVYGISGSSDRSVGDLALVNDNPMFMSYDATYKIYAARLDTSGNFVWPGNRVILSGTTASAGNPKMREGFTPVGPYRCAGVWTEKRTANYLGYAQGVSIGGLIGIHVATQGNVPPLITTDQGTLQMVDTIWPSSANQNVIWSIVPGTGIATISSSGLVTAVTNGTVYAKAVAVQDTTMKDSLMITMSNQSAQAPSVTTLDATNITGNTATLNGSVNANNLSTDVYFEWGLTPAYGNLAAGIPPTVTGNTPVPVLADISGLTVSTVYHFRAKGSNLAGTAFGQDLMFVTSDVGISEKNSFNALVYPVPNKGVFMISLRSPETGLFTIEVYDPSGSKVLTRSNITATDCGIIKVDLGQVSSGIYLVILQNGDRKQIFKVPVSR